jgi:hypothetical protein
MSHFSVLVCLPGNTDLPKLDHVLSEVMEPWDENRRVEPYRDYEDGSPDEFWWVRSVRHGAEHHCNGTGIRPHDPNVLGYSTDGPVRETPEQQRAAFAEDARYAEQLGDQPGWELVVRLYNEKYHPGNALAEVTDDSDSERLHYDPETNRAYTISTCNPESMWDYWRIGGRWRNYFVAHDLAAGLVTAHRSWDSPPEPTDRLGVIRCDGGPISALDFEAMRRAEEREAHKRYDRWETVAAAHPPARSWSEFCSRAELGEIGWDEARQAYGAQPLIAAWREDRDNMFGGCPLAEFLPPREEYVAEARRGAVPGYALVTLDREWVAPGRMGWFGMSTDSTGEKSAYRIGVNQYLDQLDPSTVVVVLDCHI